MDELQFEEYYNKKLDRTKSELIKIIYRMFGEEFGKLFEERLNYFAIYLIIKENDLKLNLIFDTVSDDDKAGSYGLLKWMHANFDKLVGKEKDQMIVGKLGHKMTPQVEKMFFEDDCESLTSYYKTEKRIYYASKYNIFPSGDRIIDKSFIYDLIYFCLFSFDDQGTYLSSTYPTISFKNDSIGLRSTLYAAFIMEIARNISIELHEKGLFIFDDREQSIKVDNYYVQNDIHYLPAKFCHAFMESIPIFLVDPQTFIDAVGEENFKHFVDYIVGDKEIDIEKLVDEMVNGEKGATDDLSITVDVGLIEYAMKKIKKKKKEENPPKKEENDTQV